MYSALEWRVQCRPTVCHINRDARRGRTAAGGPAGSKALVLQTDALRGRLIRSGTRAGTHQRYTQVPKHRRHRPTALYCPAGLFDPKSNKQRLQCSITSIQGYLAVQHCRPAPHALCSLQPSFMLQEWCTTTSRQRPPSIRRCQDHTASMPRHSCALLLTLVGIILPHALADGTSCLHPSTIAAASRESLL